MSISNKSKKVIQDRIIQLQTENQSYNKVLAKLAKEKEKYEKRIEKILEEMTVLLGDVS